MDKASLLQQGGIGIAQVGSLRRSRQHQQLRDDAAHPGSNRGVVASLAGSSSPGILRSTREGNPPGRLQGGRVGAERQHLLTLGQVEEALRCNDRGVGLNDRGLEGSLLREEVVPHGDKAEQLLAPLVRRPLRPHEEGEGLGGRGGQRHPQLVDALAGQILPGQDALVRRQPA